MSIFSLLILIVAIMEIEEEMGKGDGKYFIVVYGPPASGKSSLARQIY